MSSKLAISFFGRTTMKREESSTLLTTLLFSVIIITHMSEEVKARTLPPICSSSCGDIQNISYPFRLQDDPPGCGDLDYQISCKNNEPILEFYQGNYLVKKISYEEQIIRVVDVNLANGSCNLPSSSLSLDEVKYDFRYSGFMINTCAKFVKCSSNISDPAYIRVPCLSRNASLVYVIYGSCLISELSQSCELISMVPAVEMKLRENSYGAIQKLLESGFDLGWSVECRDCIVSGASCVVTSWDSPYSYECDRPDHFVSTVISNFFQIIGSLLWDLILIARFIFAPIVVFVFLIHKFRTTRKAVDTVEKFQRNMQSLMPKRYSYTDIMSMTDNFRDKFGQGGLGTVYRGQLPSGSGLIVIKMLENSKFSEEDFINEVNTIGRIHHVNVVRLVGFCSEGSKRALVYEYMPNGSLDKHIFLKAGNVPSLSWEKLHEIALGTARGIEYLHRGCDVCILHFDIKPHNILFDHSFIPKISDFGLAKFYPKEYDFVSVSTTRGTIGYIAPELISKNLGPVSCKSNVYSFGILLLEMVRGRKNVDAKAKSSSEVYFPLWVYDHLHEGGDLELVNETEIQVKIVRKLCTVGLWCIQMKASDRPTMTKVVEMLEGNVDDLEMPPKPFLSSLDQHMSLREPQSDSSTELLISESMEES